MKKNYIAPATEAQTLAIAESIMDNSINVYDDAADSKYDVLSREDEDFGDDAWGSAFE